MQSARTYAYQSEKECDANVDIFLKCIQAVKDTTPEGFAAIKLTALGNPLLLERLTVALLEIRKFYGEFDADDDGRVTFEEFRTGWEKHFYALDEGKLQLLYDLTRTSYFNKNNKDSWSEGGDGNGHAAVVNDTAMLGLVDFVDFTTRLDPRELPELVAQCLEEGPLSRAAPTEEELVLMEAMMTRLETLAQAAQLAEVRLMIDAEQTYFQPAIDHMVLRLQRKYNHDYPTIFNTYQCYLLHTEQRVKDDLERARRDGFKWGAKLVRGAYLVSERQRALENGYADPTQPSIEATHDCYNECLRMVLEESISKGEGSNVLIASHNQVSVETTISLMQQLGISKTSGGVYFGQLLGMADHLSYTLGGSGYKVYKYVPYGPVHEVMPYLIRRAQENSGMMGSPAVEHEADMVNTELHRRLPMLKPLVFATAVGAVATAGWSFLF